MVSDLFFWSNNIKIPVEIIAFPICSCTDEEHEHMALSNSEIFWNT